MSPPRVLSGYGLCARRQFRRPGRCARAARIRPSGARRWTAAPPASARLGAQPTPADGRPRAAARQAVAQVVWARNGVEPGRAARGPPPLDTPHLPGGLIPRAAVVVEQHQRLVRWPSDRKPPHAKSWAGAASRAHAAVALILGALDGPVRDWRRVARGSCSRVRPRSGALLARPVAVPRRRSATRSARRAGGFAACPELAARSDGGCAGRVATKQPRALPG